MSKIQMGHGGKYIAEREWWEMFADVVRSADVTSAKAMVRELTRNPSLYVPQSPKWETCVRCGAATLLEHPERDISPRQDKPHDGDKEST